MTTTDHHAACHLQLADWLAPYVATCDCGATCDPQQPCAGAGYPEPTEAEIIAMYDEHFPGEPA